MVFTIPKYLGEYETYPTGLGLIFHFSSCSPLWVIRRNRLFLHAFLVWIYTAWNTSLIVFGPHSERLRTSLWMSLLDLNLEIWFRSLRASERLNCSVRAPIWMAILATTLMNFLWNSSRALHDVRQRHKKHLEINMLSKFYSFPLSGVSVLLMFHQWLFSISFNLPLRSFSRF